MIEKLTFIATQAALRAGEILRRGYGTQCNVSFKPGAHNLVTEYDHAAEKAIIQLIREHFPDHAILAEESGADKVNDASVLWIIDPLDGSMNFAHDIPLFAVSIGVMVENEMQVGVIYIPMTHELFVAAKGQGAYCNGNRISVSNKKTFEHVIGATGFPYHIDKYPSTYLERFMALVKLGNPMRDLGSAAINLAYVAAGRFDVYWIDSLQPWDLAAGKLLVEEAGGQATQYNGTPLPITKDSSLVATNGLLHEMMLKNFR